MKKRSRLVLIMAVSFAVLTALQWGVSWLSGEPFNVPGLLDSFQLMLLIYIYTELLSRRPAVAERIPRVQVPRMPRVQLVTLPISKLAILTEGGKLTEESVARLDDFLKARPDDPDSQPVSKSVLLDVEPT